MESKRRVGVLEEEDEGGEGKGGSWEVLQDKYETIFGWMFSSGLSTTKGMVYWVEAPGTNYRPHLPLKMANHECGPCPEGEGSIWMCHYNQCLAQACPALAQPTNNTNLSPSNFFGDYAQAMPRTMDGCERNTQGWQDHALPASTALTLAVAERAGRPQN